MRATSKGAFGVIQSATMSDEEKAVSMQRSSMSMFASLAMMLVKIVASIAAAGVVLFAVSLFAWPLSDLIAYSVKPLPLAATIVGVTAYGMIRHGRRQR